MLVVPNTGLSGLSHQWGRCLASNCLHCCCSSPVHSNWRREGLGVDGARPESRTKAEEELCTKTARAPRGWAAGSPEPLSRRRTHLAPGSGLRSLYRLHRVQGRRGGLCCGPASLRLQHKTRGVGAAPGSRVVARGLTPCLGEPGRAGEPAPRPLPGGPPGSAWRIQHAEHQD